MTRDESWKELFLLSRGWKRSPDRGWYKMIPIRNVRGAEMLLSYDSMEGAFEHERSGHAQGFFHSFTLVNR